MTGPFRVAILGCGRIAGLNDAPRQEGPIRTHAQAYRRHGAFELVAAVDPDGSRASRFKERWCIPRVLAEADALAGLEVDVVSVCSPTPEHHRQVSRLLEAPKPPRVVFVEKPLCESAAELEALARLSSRSGTAILVNHTRRFDAAHRRVARLVASGRLGGLVRGRCEYYGGWLNNGSHLVDTLSMILPGEPSVVRVSQGAPGRRGDPCWDVTLAFGGREVELESVDESLYQLFEIDLRFERGRIQLRDFGAEIAILEVAVNADGERVLGAIEGAPWRGLESPLENAVAAIADQLTGNGALAETGATLDDVRRTMSLLWRARELGRPHE